MLARVITARPAAFRRLDALAVDDGGARARLAPGPLAVLHHQIVVDRLETPGVAQLGKPAIDRAPGRQVGRDQSPWTACTHHIENRVDDLAHRPCARTARGSLRRKVRSDRRPLRVRQIGLVSQTRAVMLRASGRGPHVFTPARSRQPAGITSNPTAQPLSKRPLSPSHCCGTKWARHRHRFVEFISNLLPPATNCLPLV